jgi:hypothetical protein
MSWSDSLPDEGCEVTAAVCLAHGRFVPCRKSGEHDISSDPAKVGMVRYYQEMSAREQQSAWREPEYEEETGDWQDRYICMTEQYGDHSLGCGGHILAPAFNGSPKTVLRACPATFGGWTARMVSEEIRKHFTTVRHYQLKLPGRTENAEPSTRQRSRSQDPG